MADDMKETPKKAKKDESSQEEATVISARATAEKKSKTEPKSKAGVGKTNEAPAAVTPVQPAPAVVKSEPSKMKSQPPQSAQPPMSEVPKKSGKRTVLIVVIVAIVLICCCCTAAIAIGLAFGGWESIQDLFADAGMLALASIF